MEKRLQSKLFRKYPAIFKLVKNKKEPIGQWGIECGTGWFWLIDNLCHLIQRHINNNRHLKTSQMEVTQIKNKFGELRFYNTGNDKSIERYINIFSYLSRNICEQCGSTQDVAQNKHGWILTLCKDCRKKVIKI